ncbi:MAG: Two component regulator propeller domain-containing protein [Chlorobi bacterium OLB5]|nr:MAG: Two component regulator propeller domain-containing protein [Chlorobi bacterium OLB5]
MSLLYSQSSWHVQESNTLIDLYGVSFINENTGIIVGTNNVVLKTYNGGINWIKLDSLPYIWLNCIKYIDVNNAIACSRQGGVYKSTNGGLNWHIIFEIENFTNRISYVSGIIFILSANDGTLYKSTDLGVTFSVLNSNVHMQCAFFVDQNIGYMAGSWITGIGHYQGQVKRTTNSGLNWTIVYDSPVFIDVVFNSSMYFINQSTGFLSGYVGIYKTTNNGNNLNGVSGGMILNLEFIGNEIGFATGYPTIIKTDNGGVNWVTSYNSGNKTINSSCFVNTQTGWAVGSQGLILKTTNGGLTFINSTGGNIPDNYSLSQNYPNPFNPVTNIKFDIPKSGLVKITVYDLLGREVTSLVNQQMQPGSYSVDWDASNYPSGVYFYRIETETFTDSKKMILLK